MIGLKCPANRPISIMVLCGGPVNLFRRRRWVLALSGLTVLVTATLAVVINIATDSVPGSWSWARNGTLMWTAVGVLTAGLVVLAVLATRMSLLTGTVGVTNLLPRNQHFAGRADQMSTLRRGFRSQMAIVVLHGLGGSGKSQVALEYAHRGQTRGRYDCVWWIRAESPVTIVEDLADLALALGVPQHDDRRQTMAALHVALARRRWLLVFDNAMDAGEVRKWITPGPGHTVITTRRREFGALGTQREIGTFRRPESVAYLRERTRIDDADAADFLAAELGDLPLALAQAGANIEVNAISIAEYLARFRARRGAAARLTVGLAADYPHSVATTWLVQFDELGDRHPDARELLRFCAHLAVDDIDLMAVSGQLGPAPRAETVDALVASGLATRAGPTRVRIHRLVAEVTRHQLGEQATRAAAQVVRVLHALFPDQPWEPETWESCGRLSAHVLAATAHPGTRTREAGALLNRLSVYLEYRAELTQAYTVSFRALGITEQAYGAGDAEVATSLLNVAALQRALGQHEDAIATLTGGLETFDGRGDRPEVAGLLVMLGLTQIDHGSTAAAIATLRRAREMTEAVYPPGHPAVANVLVNLASAEMTDDPARALRTIREARAVGSVNFGPEHPETAILLAVHGRILGRLGDRTAARDLLSQAAAINFQVYGPDHPLTLESQEAASSD